MAERKTTDPGRPDALLVTSSFLPGRGGIETYLAALCAEVAPRLAVLAPAERDGKPLPSGLPGGAGGVGGAGRTVGAQGAVRGTDSEIGASGARFSGGEGDVGAPLLPYRTFPYRHQMVLPGGRAVRAIDRAAAELGVGRVLFGTPWPLSLLAARTEALGYSYATIAYAAELYVPSSVPGLRGPILRAMSRSAFILTVSHYTTTRLTGMLERAGLRVPPIERLPARVDLDRFHPDVEVKLVRDALGLSEDDRVILCFGRLVTRKGVHRVMDALGAITREVPSAVLVVAGVGPEEDHLRKQAEASGGRVIFAGRVPETEAPAYFGLADVFALPVVDRYFGREVEGLGVVMLEAAACGTPSVIGRSGGSPETVVDGETGYVIDARDRVAVAERIARILSGDELRGQMGRAARAFVEREFVEAPLPAPLLRWLDGGT